MLVVAGATAAVQLLCVTHLIPPTTLIAPSAMAVSLWQILQPQSGLYPDLLATATSIIATIVSASTVGAIAGVALHALPRLRQVLTPLLNSYYAVPTFMFYPIFIVLFGAGHLPIIAIAFLLAVVSMLTSTLSGLDRIPNVLLRTGRALRLSRFQTLRWLLLPACTPALFTGLKLVVTYAFIGVIASEFILSGQGVGYAIANAYNNFDNARMYGLMLLVIIVVTAVSLLLQAQDDSLQARRTR